MKPLAVVLCSILVGCDEPAPVPGPAPRPAEPEPMGCEVEPPRSSYDGQVAFTFDDGPDVEVTAAIANVLRRYRVPATFFVSGERVTDDATRAVVRELVADPLFTVGSHGYAHEDQRDFEDGAVVRDLERASAAIGEHELLYRFPLGGKTCEHVRAVRGRGYRIVGWTADSADWCFARGGGVCGRDVQPWVPDRFRRDMIGLVVHQLRASDGGIVLFHDVYPTTAEALERVIDAILDAGLRPAPLDRLL